MAEPIGLRALQAVTSPDIDDSLSQRDTVRSTRCDLLILSGYEVNYDYQWITMYVCKLAGHIRRLLAIITRIIPSRDQCCQDLAPRGGKDI